MHSTLVTFLFSRCFFSNYCHVFYVYTTVRIALNAERSTILSVRLSVTFRYCVQTNEDTIVQF